MAQTKLDLSDNKFEQLSTEILHLSGCTHLFGEFDLESGSTLSILPNHGAGKVLTSDGSGTATWQVSTGGGIGGAKNGLCVCGTNATLGGQLTGNTSIDFFNKDLCFCSSINNRGIYLKPSTNQLALFWADTGNTCLGAIQIDAEKVVIQSTYPGGGCCAGLLVAHLDNRICFNSAGLYRTYHDENGLWYTDNYSGSATDRWLTDKGYVDSHGGGSLSVFTITGNSSTTGYTINHAKNKQFVGVEIVRGSSPYDTVYTSVLRLNTNCVCITFDTAPASGQQFKILITS